LKHKIRISLLRGARQETREREESEESRLAHPRTRSAEKSDVDAFLFSMQLKVITSCKREAEAILDDDVNRRKNCKRRYLKLILLQGGRGTTR
jgi:hypothetical protein